jgi:hypothetical protein
MMGIQLAIMRSGVPESNCQPEASSNDPANQNEFPGFFGGIAGPSRRRFFRGRHKGVFLELGSPEIQAAECIEEIRAICFPEKMNRPNYFARHQEPQE